MGPRVEATRLPDLTTPETFTNAEQALARATAIYRQSTSLIRAAFEQFTRTGTTPEYLSTVFVIASILFG